MGVFHRRADRLVSAAGKTIVPVLVFDQFEELFTRGAAGGAERARAVAFMGELAERVQAAGIGEGLSRRSSRICSEGL